MKLLFLDIDGVLNSELFAIKQDKEDFSEVGRGHQRIDPSALVLLQHIVEETKCKIVISSSWRSSFTVKEFNELLFYKMNPVIDRVRILTIRGVDSDSNPIMYSSPRGLEIDAFLDKTDLNVKRYAILDDDNDFLLNQWSNLFRCDPYCGLSPDVTEKVIEHLNS